MNHLSKFLLLTALLLVGMGSSPLAQTNSDKAIITGEVEDAGDESVPFATIAVYSSDGQNLLDGAQSDSTGSFSLELNPGTYVVKITSLSYEPFQEQVELEEGETYRFSTVTLSARPENLEDIEVEAERSQMELRFDKRVFQVGSDVTTMGGSALDVLDNVPSVTTDIEGTVSLRGSDGVRILINGKPSSTYTNQDGALRSLPANMIKEVEVITNPSARYEAQGSAGIINIVLKKNEDKGFNGNVGGGAGYPQDYELSSNLNYRVNNINWFLNTSVDYREDEDSGSSFQRYAAQDTSYMYRESSGSDESEIDGNVRFGADFYLPANQVLTASASMDLEDGEENTTTNYTDMYLNSGTHSDGDVKQRVRRSELQEEEESDYEFEIAYENIFSGDEHKLTADFDIDHSQESEFSSQDETILAGSANPLLQRTTNDETEWDYSLRADYIQNLSETFQMEAGLNSSYEFMENTYLAEEQQNGNWIPLNAFNDNFIYTEMVNAAYGIISGDFGSFSTQVGLRLEQSNIGTELKSSGATGSQSYLNLFPSIFLNYQFNEQQSIQTSYSRRIDRPWSRMLLPFSNFSDSRSRFTGNPNLNPEFSDSYEFGFLQYWNTGSLLTSLYYRRETGQIERITTLDDQGITRIFPVNLSTEDSWGIEFSADQDLFEVFTVSANANFYKANSDGSYQGTDYSSETRSLSGRFRVEWDITDNLRYQSSLRYRGPENTTQGTRSARANVDTGLAMEMFEEQAVLSFSVRDLLDSSNIDYTANGPNFYTEREFSWSTRSFMLNFTYYFNQDRRDRRGGGPPGGGDFEGGEEGF